MAELDKDAFLSTVIHELRAPLNACLMSVNLLELKASQPAEVLRCAEVFKRNLDRQARLIQDLADVLQIVSGGIEIVADPVDLSELVERAVERSRETAGATRFEWTPPSGEVPVDADSERVMHVLETILEHTAALAGLEARVAVDLGMSDERARVTARRLAQADAPIREQKGFAVRLAIGEQILAAHCGELRRTDDGFVMELPLRGA